jgi:hypothetical protein
MNECDWRNDVGNFDLGHVGIKADIHRPFYPLSQKSYAKHRLLLQARIALVKNRNSSFLFYNNNSGKNIQHLLAFWCTVFACYWCCQVKGSGVIGVVIRVGRREVHTEFYWETRMERDHVGDFCLDGMILWNGRCVMSLIHLAKDSVSMFHQLPHFEAWLQKGRRSRRW